MMAWLTYASGRCAQIALPNPNKPPGVLIEGIPGLGPLRVFFLTASNALGNHYVETTVHFLSTEATP